jgi:hypothetical protein
MSRIYLVLRFCLTNIVLVYFSVKQEKKPQFFCLFFLILSGGNYFAFLGPPPLPPLHQVLGFNIFLAFIDNIYSYSPVGLLA